VSQLDFSTLPLNPSLLQNLSSLGYTEMTPIQAKALPHTLHGKDVIAQGKTGSGKTAVFGLTQLQKLDVKKFYVQSLVLCPTRELADQVAKELRKLARTIHNIKVLTLCGGMPFGPQVGSLEHGAHIVVGTPGRIEEHVRKGTLKLDNVNTLVLDEADRMLEMGFQDALDTIIGYIPKERQTLLFSATYPDEIQDVATRIMQRPLLVKVESTHDNESIAQHFFKVGDNTQRIVAVKLLLLRYRPDSTVIFCNTRHETQQVCDDLREAGFSVQALHGDLDQKMRDQTLVRFANKSVSILVATDVAARGLDIDALDAVINYHIARDAEVHIHRIGRTGRAGGKGIACSLYTERESAKIARIEEMRGNKIVPEALPQVNYLDKPTFKPPMACLQIDGGKKQKIRPGDIVGALTGADGIAGTDVGKIHVFDNTAYVAVRNDVATDALRKLSEGQLKGRNFRVRRIRG